MTAIQRFTPLQRLLHWAVAVCILAMLFIGVGMVSSVEPKYLTLVSIHKPLGMAILVLALIRLVVRLRYGAPPLPADLPEAERRTAINATLVKREGTPAHIVQAVLFLLENDFVTGVSLPVDGGRSVFAGDF